MVEDRELARTAQQGDKDAMSTLLSRHQGLIRDQAMRWFHIGRDIDHNDLMQAGRLGFMLGVHSFDPTKGTKLTTWCVYSTRTEINRALRELTDITVGHNLFMDVQKYEKTEWDLYQELHRKPTAEEMAERMGVSMDKLRKIEMADVKMIDLDAEPRSDAGEAEDIADFHEIIASSTNVEEEVMSTELAKQAVEGMTKLTDEQRTVIELRYFQEYTWEEIENEMGISRRTAKRREREALEALGVMLS